MRYLITGGAGFIGSNLVQRLLEETDSEIIVLDNLCTGRIENVQKYFDNDRFTFVRDSILNYHVLKKLISVCDVVYHLASSVGVKYILNNQLKSIDTIIQGTRNVFELCTMYNKRVLFASSSEIYGKNIKEEYFEDDDKLLGKSNVFRWSYAAGKTVGEYYAKAFESQGLNYDIVRFFNIVGPGQVSNYGMVIPTFVKQAINEEEITIYGNGEQIRCFTHVRDAVEICYRLSHTAKASNTYYNVGSNEAVSINELANLILYMTKSKSKKKYLAYESAYGIDFEDCPKRMPNCSKIMGRVGILKFTPLNQIVEETIQYEIMEKKKKFNAKIDTLYAKLKEHKCKVAVVGLGYVGLPLAISLSKYFSVIGFDIDSDKICKYNSGNAIPEDILERELNAGGIKFTDVKQELKEASLFIVTVPTPVDDFSRPNLTDILNATRVVGESIKKGDVVIYESTVYPGVTEDICVKKLEEVSGLVVNRDFGIGYSPERINCGDRIHTVENIIKIVSAGDEATLELVSQVYETINNSGIYKASSIKVAEAAKVIENSQRDVNIAFINEMSKFTNKMNLNIYEIIDAMNTKWNALGFTPGLVGGHCIGVDSCYLLEKVNDIGESADVLQASRKVNEGMVEYVVDSIVSNLIEKKKVVKNCKVGIVGITFKENCADIRNSKTVDLYRKLKSCGMNVILCDEVANPQEVKDMYDLDLQSVNKLNNLDVLILAIVNPEDEMFSAKKMNSMFRKMKDKDKIIVDIKGIYANNKTLHDKFTYILL